MSKGTTVTGIVTRVERTGRTMYGNPIMRIGVELTDGHVYRLRISDNSALVYVENPEFKTEPHTFALTASGRVSHVVRNGAAL